MTERLEESGFRLEVEDNLHPFRIGQCGSYQRLSGKHLKEMDIGWVEPRRICLLELKGDEAWTSQKPPSPSEALLANLEEKARDVLLMVAAVWAGSPFGKELGAELPQPFPKSPTPLKLMFLVDTPKGMEAEL